MKIKTIVVGALKTNCYLLSSEKEMAVVDPGDEEEKIISALEEEGNILKYIIYTHCHFDHVMAGNAIRSHKNGEAVIHSAEKKLFSGLKIDRFLENGDKLKVGSDYLEVIHVPGHTPGGICLLGKDFILTGDTLFKDGYGRTDLEGGSQKEMEDSLERIDSLLKTGMTIYSGHGQSFKAGQN